MLPADPDVAPGLEVEVGCSKTERRTPIAVVSWRGNSLRAAGQRLDVTVYKDGFEEGEYATVPVTLGGRFEYRSETGLRSTRSANRAFDLIAVPQTSDRDILRSGGPFDGVSVEVRKLEPGVTYWWRVAGRSAEGWSPSSVTQVDAPVCTADLIRER